MNGIKKTLVGLVLLLGLLVLFIQLSVGEQPGAKAEGVRLERMKASEQWTGSAFSNRLETTKGSLLTMLDEWLLQESADRYPRLDARDYPRPSDHLKEGPKHPKRVTWFGHSSFLIELEGERILIDPIWSERASPFSWAGPQRFHPPTIELDALSEIDAIVISHDHYDHLDMESVKELAPRALTWLCPLGVGAHLEAWGVHKEQIIEMDWWDEHALGELRVIATPSRHFSGRSPLFNDRNATLWAGWAFVGKGHRVFYSGDTAMHPEFKTIGERLGPFDLTIMEAGAYNQQWADVHLGPEQALLAHKLVRGKVMMPVHWATFQLALHNWTEPAERVLAAAKHLGVSVVIPRPGEGIIIGSPPKAPQPWWPKVPWRSLEEAPAWSSGVEVLQRPLRP